MTEQKARRVFIVSRHPASVDWIKRQGYEQAEVIDHLKPGVLQQGDLVLGTLPLHIARDINEQGVRLIHFSLDVPHNMRGREISAEMLQEMNPRLEELHVISGRKPDSESLTKPGGRDE